MEQHAEGQLRVYKLETSKASTSVTKWRYRIINDNLIISLNDNTGLWASIGLNELVDIAGNMDGFGVSKMLMDFYGEHIGKLLNFAEITSDSFGGPIKTPFFHAQNQMNGDGGTFSAGAWRVRDINTVLENTIDGASLDSAIITLPAGEYYIDASACGYRVNRHRTVIYNADTSEIILRGTSEYSGDASFNASSMSRTLGRITLSQTTDISLLHRCSVTNTGNGMGLGWSDSWAHPHVFAEVKIWRIK